MTRHVRSAVLNGQAQPVGDLPAAQIVQLDIVLPLSDQAGLDSFLSELYDPASPSYRHFLTVKEFTARFGPSQANYNAVVAFAKANGLTVVGGTRDGMDVQVKGSVSVVETAFHINMRTYQHPTEDRTFYAPDREPVANLPFQLWHISGLDNYSIPHTMLVSKSDYAQAHGIAPEAVVSHASTGSGPSASFLGSDMRAAYYGGTALTGAGQNLGLWEYEGTDLIDLAAYFNSIGQTNSVPVSLFSVDGTSTSCEYSSGCDDTEQTLDITQAIGMAPGLSSLVVYIGSSDTAIISAMTTHSPLATTIGCSWGWTPADPSTLDPYFQRMAAQGQNFFAASGDHSTWSLASSYTSAWPADDANVVSVGGTDLVTASAAGPWQSETAWSDSGGGISPNYIAIPAWQQLSGVINSSNRGSSTLRNGPDVSANANFTFYTCANQEVCLANEYGGTSFAAPMWAGYIALVNQQLAANGKPTIGFINPTIYAQNVTSAYNTNFHDITSGTSGSYSAMTGYDLVTGWGSPNGQNLINDLGGAPAPGFTLSVSPASLTVTQGASGTATSTVQDVDGFSGNVSLGMSSLPSGVTASFTPNPATGTSVLTLTASGNAATGVFNITVTGTSGTLTATTALVLTVVSPVQITPPPLTNFGQVNIGTTSQTIPVVFTFDTARTLGGVAVLTQGAANLDFADAGSDTCTPNTSYTAGQTCTVNVAFTPKLAGTRFGAVVLEDNSGNTLAIGDLQGTGVGPQINFLPGVQSVLGSGFDSPNGVAVDGSGDIYVADTFHSAVKEIVAVNGSIPASPTIRTLGSGFNSPFGIAVDGIGNVYVADTDNSAVKEIVAVNGSIPASPTILTLGSGFSYPEGVAVDANGNVYVADTSNNAIKEILAVNGSIPVSPTINIVGNGFLQPRSVAVDGSGNVYACETIASVQEILAVDGSIPASPTIVTLASGFTSDLSGVAVDGRGNLYLTDWYKSEVFEIPAVNGSIPSSPNVLTIATGLSYPYGVAVDSSGNIYVPNWGNSEVVKLDLADAPSLSFAAIGVGSTGNPQTVTVENVGNAALSFPIPSSGNNPTISANFTLNSSDASACPLVSASSSTPGTLASGASCQLPISFAPTTLGAVNGSLALTDTNLNAAAPGYATQSISLSGSGTFTLTASPVSLTVTQGASNTSTITVTGASGSVSLAATSLPSGVTASFTPNPTNGTSVLTLVASSTAPTGTYNVIVNGTSNSQSAATTLTLTVNPVPSFNLSASPASLTVIQGGSGTSTIAVTGQNGFTGSVTLAASGLPSGVTASFATNPTTGTSVLTLTASSIAPVGTTTVAITGTSGTLAATATIALTVSSPPSFTLGASPASISIQQGASGTSTMITTVSGSFDSNVLFSVSGQPAGVSVGGLGYIAAPGSGSSTMIVAVASTVATGTYPITVTATGEGITQTAPVSLTVLQSSVPAAYFSGVDTVLASGYGGPADVAVDKNGNVYIAEWDGGTIDEIVAVNGSISASSPIRTLTKCTIVPACSSVAIDNNGNVYFIDYETIKEILAVNGSIPASPVITTITSNAPYPSGLAVDGSGNVYVSDDYDGKVNEILAVNGTVPASPTIRLLASGLSEPGHLALDNSGNLYVAGGGGVQEIVAVNGSIPASPAIIAIPGGAYGSRGVAVDANGDVYFSDENHEVVSEILAVNGSIPPAPAVIELAGMNVNLDLDAVDGIAVDSHGNVFIANIGFEQVLEVSTAGGNFGQVNTGATSPAIALNFSFGAATTLGWTAVLTQGATGLDFADAGTGSCKASTPYTAGQTCTMNVTFTSKFAGTRNGAAVLYDSNGNAIATAYLHGMGVGPQVSFSPGSQSTLGSGFYNPMGVAVDGRGDVFVGDETNGVVKEILAVNGTIPASPTILSLGSFSYPHGVAVDGAGNVYVADMNNNAVKEILAVNGSVPASPTIRTLGGGFSYPWGVAVDNSGNVYVAEPYSNTIAEIVAVNGSIPLSPTIRTLGSGFDFPFGVAVDGSGNVYVADTYHSLVKEMLAVNGSIPASPAIVQLGSGYYYPGGAAVDGNGNVYVADYGNNTVKELMAVNGSIPASPAINTLASGLNSPFGVTVDGSLNVYIADTENNRIMKLDFADAPSLNFANTVVGSTSTDSPQTVTVENVGNAALNFPVPSAGNNPGITANFTLNSSGASACPLVGASSSTAGTLAAGASCQLPISFTPTAAGALSGSLILTDSNLNAAAPGYAMQTITLSGTGTQITPTITWAMPKAITYGTPLSGTQLNASSPVAGSFIYSPAAGTVLTAGQQTLTATFTPTDTTDYTTATASVTLTVNKATPSITWTTPAAITYGTPLSATQLNATASVAGGFTYSPAAGTVLTAGSHTLSVTFAPTDSTDYTTATTTVTLTVNQATPIITWATPAAITYGTALSGAQLNATSTVAGTFTYSPAAGTVLNAGTQTLTATFAPTDTIDYTTATASVPLLVNKAPLTINWTTPAAIPYGTTLSGTQLDATSTAAGTFAYSPAAGTMLGVGNHTLAVTLTPTNPTDYTTATATATVTQTVNKAAPAITWATPAAITYGTPLSATQLDASSTVAGNFTYSPVTGTVLTAGQKALTATFTPTNSTDYTTATATVTLTVNKATPTITWATPAAITYGTALSATQLDAKSSVPGTLVYSPAAGTIPAVGTDTLTVTFTPTDTTDYTTAADSVLLKVNPALSFTLGASPASLVVAQGASGKSTITVSGQNGFTGSITLASSGLPSGVTAVFATNPTTGTSSLTLTASSAVATGTATVTIKGNSGSLTASTTIALTISCTPTTIVPYISVNGGSTWTEESSATVNSASTLVDFGPQPSSGGSWSWTGPNGYKSTSRQINSIPLTVGADSYLATYTNVGGCKSTETFTINVK
jgi:sugar lactone lactonase YvrE